MMIKACRVQNIFFKNFFLLKICLADCSLNDMPQTYLDSHQSLEGQRDKLRFSEF